MKPWIDRPAELGNLLNPAYCGLLLANVAIGYVSEGAAEIDASLLFVALPLALHRDTRESLPKTIRTKLHTWINENQALRIGLADRCSAMVPFVKEALIFSCNQELLAINDTGGVVPLSAKKVAVSKLSSPEVRESIERAHFIGRWLLTAGPSHVVYAVLGLRP
jgi:hypothetical protein